VGEEDNMGHSGSSGILHSMFTPNSLRRLATVLPRCTTGASSPCGTTAPIRSYEAPDDLARLY